MRDLRGIKAKRPVAFTKPLLFKRVMLVLEQHHFRLHHIRFVLDLFEKGVMRQIVLEEEEEDEEEEDEGVSDKGEDVGEDGVDGQGQKFSSGGMVDGDVR